MQRIKRLLAVLLAVLILTALFCGCAKKSENPAPSEQSEAEKAAGKYIGQYTKFVGDPEDVKDETDDFYLELKPDGTGLHHRNGLDINITWKLEEGVFSMDEMSMIQYTGAFTDGGLVIYNGDPTNDLTCQYVYKAE